MMSLVLVTPPAGFVVDPAELAGHRRLPAGMETSELVALEAAAVAYLDGYRGVLGRAILPQVWKQEFCGWGTLRLAMPDVTAITVTGLTTAGGAVTATRADLRLDAMGPYVIAEGPDAERVFVEFTCALPMQQMASVQAAVKMLVGHWFENREAVVIGTIATELPMAVDALLAPLRWSQM